MNRYKSRKPTKSILAKKEKGYQQYGILLFTMLKTLDSFLYWNPILTKTQPCSRNLQTVMLCMTYQHTRREECVSQSRNTLWASHPTFRFDSTFPTFYIFSNIIILKYLLVISERWVSNLKSIHEKNIFPNYIELAKNHEELGDFLGPKNPLTKKFTLNLASNCWRKWIGTNRENPPSLSWRKRRKDISNRNTVIHDAENLGLVPLLEPNSDKDSTMEQELANCHAVYDIATYKKRRVCVTIKKYSVSKPPYIQIWLYIS